MTPEQREIVWRFIRQLNRLARARFLDAVALASTASDPGTPKKEQEKAMAKVAILIGEYDE